MTDVLIIDGIECVIKRNGGTLLGISVERDGSVHVSAPQDASTEAIKRYVSSKRLWIHQKITYKRKTNKEEIHREFVNGQGFLYLGKSYRLKLLKDYNDHLAVNKANAANRLRFQHGYFELAVREQSHARDHFISWYKSKTEEQLKMRIPRYDKRVGADVKNFRVLDLGNRWASCGIKGTLNFNWRIVMAPIWVFDYILVHELAHMIQKGHTKDFWRIVERVIPDYQEHEAWLKQHGVELHV